MYHCRHVPLCIPFPPAIVAPWKLHEVLRDEKYSEPKLDLKFDKRQCTSFFDICLKGDDNFDHETELNLSFLFFCNRCKELSFRRMGLRDFKNEIMWNCVITGNVLCAELYTSSRNTIISNETCRYIIPGCYTKRTSEIEIILQENRNRYARDTHLFPRPTIVKNTPLIYLLSWIIMYSIQSFFKIRKSESKRILRSFSLF